MSDDPQEEDGGGMTEAEIDGNLRDTFPASDPPSWTLGIGPHQRPRAETEELKPSDDEETSRD
ncbi:MAG TPA: hypothetical protein VFS10_17470 [Pyrinomonadaceae bacterium]|nr:hypothetical protein [Pyrinomonadaceae bacterium]